MSHGVPLAGVVGWPVGHSRSPALHGHWLRRYGLAGHYVPLAVAPEDFADALRMAPKLGFVGVNVTIPHKEAAAALADVLTPAARRLGAANTLTFKDGKIFADNTDGYGFIENIRAGAAAWRAEAGAAAVLGAGGAARAVVAALLDAGAPEVILANRTRERAERLAADIGGAIRVVDWAAYPQALADAATIVNTTSLGMAGGEAGVFDLSAAPVGALATDIVYTPLMTPFLTAAAARGMPIVDGLGMLLHQGRPGFERWCGHAPVVDDALRAAVLGA